MAVITSASNPRLKLMRKLASARQRHKLGLFAVEGEDLVEAGLAAGLEPVELLVAGENVSPELLASVSLLPHPARQIAVFRRDDLPRIGSAPVADTGLALWHVADPGNVGTILRAADGLRAFVALSSGCADPTGPKAVRASMGALFRVPIVAFADVSGRRVALVAHGGEPLRALALDGPTTFLLGSEREGLPDDVDADVRATIELPGAAESLNVAAAAAVALYDAAAKLSA
jgi:TrmH family RNA methyltransferase